MNQNESGTCKPSETSTPPVTGMGVAREITDRSGEPEKEIETLGHTLAEIGHTIKDLESFVTSIIKETAVAHTVGDRLNLLVFNAAVDSALFHERNLRSLSERVKGLAECTMATTYVLSGSMEAAAELVRAAGERLSGLESSLVSLVNAVRYLSERADMITTDLYGKSAA